MSGRRLAATTVYLLVDLLRGQRVLVPAIVFVLLAGVLLINDHAGAPGPWPATALGLYAIAAWVGLVAANAEDPVARSVTVASAGGPGLVTIATGLTAMTVSSVLALSVVLLPGLINPTGFPPVALLAGGLAHLCAAAAGTAVGLVTGRPLISRLAWSFTVATMVIVATASQPWLPPVGDAARALGEAAPVGPLVLDFAVALLALVAAGAVSWWVSRRE